jgi:hypothetical protein
VTDNNWVTAAKAAVKKADAFIPDQIVGLMKEAKVPIGEMDEWCAISRLDYPCMFKAWVVDGLGKEIRESA